MSDNNSKSPLDFIITIATLIAAIAFLVKIFGKDDKGKREEEAKKSREKTYGKLTYPDYRYKDWSDDLIEALVPNVDEDEDAVYKVFEKQKTIGDVNKLIDYFGDQRHLFTMNWMSLPQFISTLFSKSEKQKLNKILAERSIDYTFE